MTNRQVVSGNRVCVCILSYNDRYRWSQVAFFTANFGPTRVSLLGVAAAAGSSVACHPS